MIEYAIDDAFDATVDHYWDTFFSAAYNEALWDHLAIDYELLELRREGEGDTLVIHRRQRLTPRREVPLVLRKLVSGPISYEERNVFRRRESKMEVVTVPSFAADRVDTRGTYEVVAAGAGVRRIWRGHVACRVPLLGGAVEKHIVGEVKASYAKTTEFTRTWLAEHPAADGARSASA